MQMLKDKLKPCPFCGSRRVQIKNVLSPGRAMVHIVCICGGGVYAPTVFEAVEGWNERSKEDASNKWVYGDEE